jgi:predicted nucleotidyltransferase
MRNIERLSLQKFSPAAKEPLFEKTLAFIEEKTPALEVIFFGSIVTDQFDAWSDIDVVAIYPSREAADQARRTIYGSRRPEFGHSIEVLCVDQATFDEKSKTGGVYFIAQQEGRSFKMKEANSGQS